MKVYVGGINGSGKTTILKQVAERLGFEYVPTSKLLMERLGRPSDYEYLRSRSQEEKMKIREEMFNDLMSQGDKNFLVDAHYLNIIRGEIHTIIGPSIKNFDVLVLISAPIWQIMERIHIDGTIRDRALFADGLTQEKETKILSDYQEDNKKEFLRVASLYHKKNIEIINQNGQLESSIAELVDFLKQC